MMLLLCGLLATAHTETAVPFKQLGGIIAGARINGQAPAPFIIDTGAGVVLLDDRFAIRARLQGVNASTGRDISGKAVASHELTLSRISIGGACVERVQAVTFALPLAATYLGAGERAGGIIGAPFLRRYAVTIDYPRHTLRFAKTYSPPAKARALPMTLTPDGIPIISILVDGVPARGTVDTGNTSEAILWPSLAAKLRLLQRSRAKYHTQENGVAGSARATSVRIAALQIGGETLRDLAIDIPAAKPAGAPANVQGNIGEDVLDRFIVTLDYLRHKAYFVPAPALRQYRAYTPTGMSLRRNDDGTMTVTAVTPATPAANAQFKAGDTVVRVDGEPISRMSGGMLAQRVRRSLGKTMHWTVRRAGRSITLLLRPRDLLPAVGV